MFFMSFPNLIKTYIVIFVFQQLIMLCSGAPTRQEMDKILSEIPASVKAQWMHSKRSSDLPRHQTIEEFSELQGDNSDELQMESVLLQDEPLLQSDEANAGGWYETVMGWGKRSAKPVSTRNKLLPFFIEFSIFQYFIKIHSFHWDGDLI